MLLLSCILLIHPVIKIAYCGYKYMNIIYKTFYICYDGCHNYIRVS
jgi:hypothetical protein